MIDFIGKKYYFFALSIAIIVIGFVVFMVNGGLNGGFKLDIQFLGGTVIEMQMNDGNFDKAKAEAVIKKEINKKATVQQEQTINTNANGSKIYLMKISIASSDALKNDEQTRVINAIRKEFSVKEGAEISTKNVMPSFGQEIMRNGLMAVLVSSLLIILYIAIRFRVMSGWSAGVMAILALLHDVLLMLAVYVVFRITLDEAFIAAVLTVIGYSMNDTIIIYDRIRENSKLLRKMPIAELANRSINQTLGRSINTVVTVLICIVTVFIFASYNNIQSMMDFTRPLIVGIASGCYSSIFVASPLWVMWREAQDKRKTASRRAVKA